jgi:hypothetical protein
MRPDGTKAQVGLQNQAAMWTTPKAISGGPNSKREERGAGGPDLQEQAIKWPTPNATDGDKGSPGQEYNSGLPSLTRAAVVLWPTPQARDIKGANKDELQDRGSKGAPLNEVAVLWPTPTSLGFGDSHQPGNSRSMNKTLELAEPIFSRQDPATYPVGQVSSHLRRSLNPLFVEWLMGWPPGWTLLAWTDFACSATALSAWQQRMRSALLSLASPQPAIPAQLSLLD